MIPDTLLDALRQLPAYPIDLKSIGAPLVEDWDAYFDDPYSDPWLADYDFNQGPPKPHRWAPPPDWWIEQDRRGVRECVRDYGDRIEQTIAERLAGGEVSPFWRLVRWLEKAYQDTGIDVEGVATLALARFLARTRPGTEYRERYLPLYSYVLDRWAMRYVRSAVRNAVRRQAEREVRRKNPRPLTLSIETPDENARSRIACKPVADTAGARSRQQRLPRLLAGGIPDHRPPAYSPELLEAIGLFVVTLSPRWAEIFRLCCLEGMKQRDIADMLGMHRNGVGKALDRIAAQFRERFPEFSFS